MILALAGNPNCGKTTLFNALTGAGGHVGNFPGVTVEGKRAPARLDRSVTVVDLPGIYSLRPYSPEERVARDYLLGGEPDGIINIVDAGSLERNLYLTLQLVELGLPTVLALNMMDEVERSGGRIRTEALSRSLGIPVVPVSALRGDGVQRVLKQAAEAAGERRGPSAVEFYTGPGRRCVHTLEELIAPRAAAAGIPPRYGAVKLIEGDGPTRGALRLDAAGERAAEAAVAGLERELGTDRNAALADMRYRFIEALCARAVVGGGENHGEKALSPRLDRVLTHKYLALPLFVLIMLGVFYLTFGPVGGGLSDLLGLGIARLSGLTEAALARWGVGPALRSLVIDGLFAGVGTVLSFLPIIMTMFFCLSLLEDSGYMARVAFVMDRPLRKIGLSGRSIVPLLVGFGCTVPAVMATRTLPGERDRRLTILLTPFMSCSAKLPIYGLLTAALFPRYRVLVMLGLYLAGVGLGLLAGAVLSRTRYRGEPVPFVMELPDYRLPGAGSVLRLMWEKGAEFVRRAFSVILLATLLIWFLGAFDYRLNMVDDPARSLLGTLSMAISPLFVPLGFTDWRITTALISGLTAKEAVVSTLSVLMGTGAGELAPAIRGLFTPLSALSFLTFTLLYTPCVAAIAAVRRELGGGAAAKLVIVQCAVAWLAGVLVYQAGTLVLFWLY